MPKIGKIPSGILTNNLKYFNMKVKINKLHEYANTPRYATDGSAGFDLTIVKPITLKPNQRGIAQTGLSFEIPKGFEMQIRPGSGLAAILGVTVLNSPGTIDSDFRGEVCVILYNSGLSTVSFPKGARIAQGVICKVDQAEFEEVDELSETDRGNSGFGSTGV